MKPYKPSKARVRREVIGEAFMWLFWWAAYFSLDWFGHSEGYFAALPQAAFLGLIILFAALHLEKVVYHLYAEQANAPPLQTPYMRYNVSYSLVQLVQFYLLTFSSAYQIASRFIDKAFNVGRLDSVDALYFAVVTFATVGYGDIIPTSRVTKLLVTGEIITGMLFAFLLLSVVANYIRGPGRA